MSNSSSLSGMLIGYNEIADMDNMVSEAKHSTINAWKTNTSTERCKRGSIIVLLLNKFNGLAMKRSRNKKLDDFYSLCTSDVPVLDVGVSNIEHNNSINIFLNSFKYSSENYTGLAVEPMDKIRQKHPDKKFIEYPGGVFPFEDNKFEWVFSNAVLEHVGNRNDQILFINEMLRVAKNVFFTTPNKYFPVESHTNVLFRHWFDESFYKWCKKNKPYWSKENLILLDYKNLKSLMRDSEASKYDIRKNRLAGWVMTFTVICSR